MTPPLAIDAQKADPLSEALLRVFARYCELIIQRLNRVPAKNHAAFLNLLNVSRIPPLPAQVPLTFTPVTSLPGEPGSIRVPARTQIAAAPGEGETEPVVFETTRDVILTNIELKKILALDPQTDLYADKSYLANPEQRREGEFAFDGHQPVVHELYLGHAPIFAKTGITTLRLQFEIEEAQSLSPGRQLVDWWIPAGDTNISLHPVQDETGGLTRSGEVVFKDLPQWPPCEVFEKRTHWFGCRLRNRLQMQNIAGRDHPPKLPTVNRVTISAEWEIHEGLLEDAHFNAMQLDLSKDFYPFGERPRFGDVFYLKCDAFSNPLARAALHVRLTNPAAAGKDAPIPAVNDRGEPVIQWECWNGRRWTQLACEDGTAALVNNGVIVFTVPAAAAPTMVNGTEGYWIRARLVSGNYGEDERWENAGPDRGLRVIPATLAPPSIQSIAVTAALAAGPEQPEQIVSHNNFFFKTIQPATSFEPFQMPSEPYRALLLGLNFPDGGEKTLTQLAVDLYFHMRGAVGRAIVRGHTKKQLPELAWQYWNGSNWLQADTADETESLTRSGLISIRTGADVARCKSISCEIEPCFWVRVLWLSGSFECPPKLCRVLLNTVSASQITTIENELLGSSNGLPKQIFRAARRPILHNVLLEVREPDRPSADDYQMEGRPGPGDTNDDRRERGGNDAQIWVRWKEVENFLSSTHYDRHFLVDRQRGEIRFGDGIQGLIPPPAANNIRLQKYQTGGGLSGNKPAGSISQLRSSVAYVSAATNLEPGLGGQNIEDGESVRRRGASLLRHRRRAVTLEDYEDLAKLASSDVARAKCYPNLDLAQDPAGTIQLPGVVSLILVPNSREPKPMPDLNLLHRVAKFMDAHRAADTELILLAPEYVRVDIEAVIVPVGVDTGAAAVERSKQEIVRYLHPLTGGSQGRGWKFGRRPQESDLYACLEAIPELEYVRSLEIHPVEEREGLLKTAQFLIFAGEPKIQLRL